MFDKDFFFNSLIRKDQILVCDFDGVFVDSINLKGECFVNIFSKVDLEMRNRIIEHHINNQSLDRFEKIKIYYFWINGFKISSEKLSFLVNKFGNICEELLIQKKPSKFITSLLKFRKGKKNFIVTKSVSKEVNFYLEKFKLDIYINHIFDSKIKKHNALKQIISSNRIESFDLVYIGDNESDKISSDMVNCKFIFYKAGTLNFEEKFFRN